MKTAVVLGARQDFGFRLCEQLLDKGYRVIAGDFQQWQTVEQEERWLFIGRNANLCYVDLEKYSEHRLPDIIDFYFIPVVDFFIQPQPVILSSLFQILLNISGEMNPTVVFTQPAASDLKHSVYTNQLEQIKGKMEKNNIRVVNYYLSNLSGQEPKIFYPSGQRNKCHGIVVPADHSPDNIMKEIIQHFEHEIIIKHE